MLYPPSQGLALDIEAISGICGSVSIACWIVVFSPQIVENFRRGSAEGLSVVFIVVWLLGDLFNIVGAVLQGVLPTMIILAVYYTLADIVLLAQCFYYKGFTLSDKPLETGAGENGVSSERSPLLQENGNGSANGNGEQRHTIAHMERRLSRGSIRDHLLSLDGAHLSPAMPFISEPSSPSSTRRPQRQLAQPTPPRPSSSPLRSVLLNMSAVILVCAAGVGGWLLSSSSSSNNPQDNPPPQQETDTLQFNLIGQISGYICAILYLGSRIPQILLNYRRKSTEGISLLFFLFAVFGNLTYVLSILAYSPVCRHPRHCRPGEAGKIYWRYFLVNFSWLLGSFGTLVLDGIVFVQFFVYAKNEVEDGDETEEEEEGYVREDDRRI